MNDVIRTENLTKRFHDLTAVDRLNWLVPQGAIVGFLGPNGAGKTTTLKMLLGMTHPTDGKGEVLGLDTQKQCVEVCKRTAFVPEDKLIYDSMHVEQFLRFYGSFFPDWSEKAEAEFLRNWAIHRDEKIKNLSRGMRAKLLLAATMSRKPSLLIFDEPTEGLDPESIEEVLSLIARWCSSGDRTVVIATHRLDEVERICDRVSILSRGRLLLSGNIDDLKAEWKTIEIFGELSEADVQSWEGIQQVHREGLSTRIIVSGNLQEILNQLKQFPNITTNLRDMNLREIYLAAIKRQGGIDYAVLEDLV